MIDIYACHIFIDGSLVSNETLIQTVPAENIGDLSFIGPKVKEEIGNAGSFEFSIRTGTPFFDSFKQMKSYIRVTYDEDTIFYGRVLTINDSAFSGERKIHCEGAISLLIDSYYPGGSTASERPKVSTLQYLTNVINNHNSQVVDENNPVNKFYLGEVPGQYSASISSEQQIKNDEYEFGKTNWSETKSALEEVRSRYGGCFRARYSIEDYNDTIGRWGYGNIDLNNRIVVHNPDGSISTERSFSTNIDGKEVLLPTVINGEIKSEAYAIEYYHQTGEYLGKFDTVDEAEDYAILLHDRQDWYYNGQHKVRRLYLDWLNQYYRSTVNEQTVEIGKNIINLNSITEVNNIFTVLIPVGKTSDSKQLYLNGYRTDIHGDTNYITVPDITKVYTDAELNSGYHKADDYRNAIDKYGWIVKVVDFSDASTQEELFNKATEWIKDNYNGEVINFTVTAIDMHQIGENVDKIRVGDRVKVIYPIGSASGTTTRVERILTCTAISYDLYHPENNSYSFGIPTNMQKTSGVSGNKKSASGRSTTPTSTPDAEEPDPASQYEKWLKEVRNWFHNHKIWYKSTGRRQTGSYFLNTLEKKNVISSTSGTDYSMFNPIINGVQDLPGYPGVKQYLWAKDSNNRPRSNFINIDDFTIAYVKNRYLFEYVIDEYGVDLRLGGGGLGVKTAMPSITEDEAGNISIAKIIENPLADSSGLVEGLSSLTSGKFDVVDGILKFFGTDGNTISIIVDPNTGDIQYLDEDGNPATIRDLHIKAINTDTKVGWIVTEDEYGDLEFAHPGEMTLSIENFLHGEMVVSRTAGELTYLGNSTTQRLTEVSLNHMDNVCGDFYYEEDEEHVQTIVVRTGGGFRVRRGTKDEEGHWIVDPDGQLVMSEFGVFDDNNLTGGIVVEKINDDTVVTKIKGSRVDIEASQVRLGDTSNVAEAFNLTEEQFDTLEGVVAGKATIVDLNAVKARISNIEADYITTNNIYAAIAALERVNVRSLTSERGGIAVHSVATDSYTQGDVDCYVPHAIYNLQIVQEGNTYTLQRKRFAEDDWTDVGSFSRATSLSGAWSGAVLSVNATPQNEHYTIGFGSSYGTNDMDLEVQGNGSVIKSDIIPSAIVVPITVNSLNSGQTAPTSRYTKDITFSVASLLQSKTVTDNGTVMPDEGYIGLSSITVDVQGGSTSLSGDWNGSTLFVNASPQDVHYAIGFGSTYGTNDIDLEVQGNGTVSKSDIVANSIVVPIAVNSLNSGQTSPTLRYSKDLTMSVASVLQSKTITSNGTITPDEDYIGFRSVTVNVQDPSAVRLMTTWENNRITVTKTMDVSYPTSVSYGFVKGTETWSGTVANIPILHYTTDPTRPDGAAAYIDFDIDNKLQTKTVMSNGTVTPDTGYVGFKSVRVSVPDASNVRLMTVWEDGRIVVTKTTDPLYPDSVTYGFVKGTENWSGTIATIPILHYTWDSTRPDGVVDYFDFDVSSKLQTKTVTSNGIVTPDSNYIGLSSVTVSIQDFDSARLETTWEDGRISISKTTNTTCPTSVSYGFVKGTESWDGTTITIPVLHYTTDPTRPDGRVTTVSADVYSKLQSKTVTSNGIVTPDSGYIGLRSVYVNTQDPSVVRLVTTWENGRISVSKTTDSSYPTSVSYGFVKGTESWSGTVVTIPVLHYTTDSTRPDGQATTVSTDVSSKLQSKTIRVNSTSATYTPDSGYIGFSSFTVEDYHYYSKNLERITITQNGEYNFKYHGIDPVNNIGWNFITVNVANPTTIPVTVDHNNWGIIYNNQYGDTAYTTYSGSPVPAGSTSKSLYLKLSSSSIRHLELLASDTQDGTYSKIIDEDIYASRATITDGVYHQTFGFGLTGLNPTYPLYEINVDLSSSYTEAYQAGQNSVTIDESTWTTSNKYDGDTRFEAGVTFRRKVDGVVITGSGSIFVEFGTMFLYDSGASINSNDHFWFGIGHRDHQTPALPYSRFLDRRISIVANGWNNNINVVDIRIGDNPSTATTYAHLNVDGSSIYANGQYAVTLNDPTWSNGTGYTGLSNIVILTTSGRPTQLTKSVPITLSEGSWSNNSKAISVTTTNGAIVAQTTVNATTIYNNGRNAVTLNNPTWSNGTGYTGLSNTVNITTSGRPTQLTKSVPITLSVGAWENNQKTISVTTTNGAIVAQTIVNAPGYTPVTPIIYHEWGEGGKLTVSTSPTASENYIRRFTQSTPSWNNNIATVPVVGKWGSSEQYSETTTISVTVDATERYNAGRNAVTLNDPTWSNGTGYTGLSNTINITTSGRPTQLTKSIPVTLSQGAWANGQKNVDITTTNGAVVARTVVNAPSASITSITGTAVGDVYYDTTNPATITAHASGGSTYDTEVFLNVGSWRTSGNNKGMIAVNVYIGPNGSSSDTRIIRKWIDAPSAGSVGVSNVGVGTTLRSISASSLTSGIYINFYVSGIGYNIRLT